MTGYEQPSVSNLLILCIDWGNRTSTWLSFLNVSTLNSPVIYVLCFLLRYPVPISVTQVCSLSLTMLPETVSYTAWLHCTITQTNPCVDIFHQSISTFKLNINQNFIVYPLRSPLPSPPSPTPTPPSPPLPTSTLFGPRVWKLVLIFYDKSLFVNYLPICSEFVSVLFVKMFS